MKKKSKNDPGSRIPLRIPGKKGRLGLSAWVGACLLLILSFSTVFFPTERTILNLFGIEFDYKDWPIDLKVDGIQAEGGYSGWTGTGTHLGPSRSEPPRVDLNAYGRPFNINGLSFPKGIGVHAPSRVSFHLNGRADRFSCFVGVDQSSRGGQSFGVYCSLIADGKEIFKSPKLRTDSNPFKIEVRVSGVQHLVLSVEPTVLEDSESNVDWVDLRFFSSGLAGRKQGDPDRKVVFH